MDTSSIPPVKRCTKCGKEKPATNEFFARDTRNNPLGLQPKCKECNALYAKENRERSKSYDQIYYQNNKDKIRAYQKENRDHINLVRREHAKENAERLREKARQYKDKNREKVRSYNREYTRKNPHIKRTIDNRRRARKNGTEATLTTQQWAKCLEYFNHRCVVCGRTQGLWHIIAQDHWVPITQNGPTCVENIIPLCHAIKDGTDGCNQSKKDKNALDWLKSRVGKHKAKQIIERIEAYFRWAKEQE